MVTVRNESNELIMVGERYLFPGRSRLVFDHVAESALSAHPNGLTVVGAEPLTVAQFPREDWTQVSGIGPQLHDALHYMGLHDKADVRIYVTRHGADALLAIPGMHKKRRDALLRWVGVTL